MRQEFSSDRDGTWTTKISDDVIDVLHGLGPIASLAGSLQFVERVLNVDTNEGCVGAPQRCHDALTLSVTRERKVAR